MRLTIALVTTIVTISFLAVAAVPQQALAQTEERCFPETGQCISGPLRAYWEQNGGLAVFGFPLTAAADVPGSDGVTRLTQWFERTRFELNPQNEPPYNVLLGRLGIDALEQQGRDWTSFPQADPNNADAERCRFFRETNHTVCDEFLTAFRSYGLDFAGTPGITYEESLGLFGLPVSEPMTETIAGKEYSVQWFERARFELHPEDQPPFNVLFGQLGSELYGPAESGEIVALTQEPWQLVSFGPADPASLAADPPATLAFESDRVSGSTGCNGFGGSYTATAETITFGPIISTLIACEDEVVTAQERAVLTALQDIRPYTIEGEELRISYDEGRQVLVYRRAPAVQQAVVDGTVTYRQRSALPPQAEVQVQLVDVSRADAPATVVASTTIQAAGNQVPFAFSLPYDPAQIVPNNSYAVQARITIDGELRFISTTRYAVITQGNPTTVEVIVEPV